LGLDEVGGITVKDGSPYRRGEKDEAEFIALLKSGNPEAQSRFYGEHRRRLYATAVHFLGYQDPEAEDVVQEAFERALRGVARFRGDSGVYTWLNHICVNLCFDRIRARKKHLLKEQADLDLLTHGLAGQAHRRGQELGAEERRLSALRSAVQAMDEPCGSLVRLRDLEGRSYAEVAKAVKIPMGTVMSRLSRCRQKLRERLRKLMPEAFQ
jgi:RNA polymerase sigma-70 factor (ECF subfamily)